MCEGGRYCFIPKSLIARETEGKGCFWKISKQSLIKFQSTAEIKANTVHRANDRKNRKWKRTDRKISKMPEIRKNKSTVIKVDWITFPRK